MEFCPFGKVYHGVTIDVYPSLRAVKDRAHLSDVSVCIPKLNDRRCVRKATCLPKEGMQRSLEPIKVASRRSDESFINCSKSLDVLGNWSYVSFRQVIVETPKAVTIADTDAKLRNSRDTCGCDD